jgi:hypothetical protein
MKKFIIITSLVTVVALGSMFANMIYISKVQAQSTTTTPNLATIDLNAGKVIQEVNTLNSIKLDTSIFKNDSFKSLVDYSRPIPSEAAGRSNPFAPLQ